MSNDPDINIGLFLVYGAHNCIAGIAMGYAVSARLFCAAILLALLVSDAQCTDQLLPLLLHGERNVAQADFGDAQVPVTSLTISDAVSSRYGLSVMWITVQRSASKIKVVNVSKNGTTEALLEAAGCGKKSIATNGGFFAISKTGERHPIGLVISEGRQLSNKGDTKYGGVLAHVDGALDIVPIKKVPNRFDAENALQSSPILIWDGRNDMRSDDGALFDRVGIGLSSDGIVVAGAFSPDGRSISLFEFAEVLEALPDLGGPPIEKMLAMDGGPSAHVYVESLNRHFGYKGENFLPNALCIVPLDKDS